MRDYQDTPVYNANSNLFDTLITRESLEARAEVAVLKIYIKSQPTNFESLLLCCSPLKSQSDISRDLGILITPGLPQLDFYQYFSGLLRRFLHRNIFPIMEDRAFCKHTFENAHYIDFDNEDTLIRDIKFTRLFEKIKLEIAALTNHQPSDLCIHLIYTMAIQYFHAKNPHETKVVEDVKELLVEEGCTFTGSELMNIFSYQADPLRISLSPILECKMRDCLGRYLIEHLMNDDSEENQNKIMQLFHMACLSGFMQLVKDIVNSVKPELAKKMLTHDSYQEPLVEHIDSGGSSRYSIFQVLYKRSSRIDIHKWLIGQIKPFLTEDKKTENDLWYFESLLLCHAMRLGNPAILREVISQTTILDTNLAHNATQAPKEIPKLLADICLDYIRESRYDDNESYKNVLTMFIQSLKSYFDKDNRLNQFTNHIREGIKYPPHSRLNIKLKPLFFAVSRLRKDLTKDARPTPYSQSQAVAVASSSDSKNNADKREKGLAILAAASRHFKARSTRHIAGEDELSATVIENIGRITVIRGPSGAKEI